MYRRNQAIDIAKYIASLLVIAIHCALFSDVNKKLYFLIVHILARTAVPFFAVCTGYFVRDRMLMMNEKKVFSLMFWEDWRKQIWRYAVWSFAYLLFSIPRWVKTGWFSAWAFVDYAVAAVRSGSYYHLWYLLSLIYSLPIFYLCLRYFKQKIWLPLSVFLYLIKVVQYGYYVFIPKEMWRILFIDTKWGGITDGFFLILPLLLLGAFLYDVKPLPRNKLMLGLFASLTMLTAEAFTLYSYGQEKVSYILFTYPTAVSLFLLLRDIQIGRIVPFSLQLARMSAIVYCLHPMIIESIRSVEVDSFVRFLITAVCATALSFGIDSTKKKWKMR